MHELYELYKKYPELEIVEKRGHHRLNARKAVLKHAPQNSVGAEIGVFTGLFSDVLAEEIPSKLIYLIDPWSKKHGTHFPNWGRYSANISLSTEAAKEAAKWRAKTAHSKCVIIEDFSSNWLTQQASSSLGWVYLDAKHTYDAVIDDLTQINRCLLPEGTIMGDDMWVNEEKGISAVYFAVRAFCKLANFDIVHLDQHGQWAIKRAAHIDSFAVSKH